MSAFIIHNAIKVPKVRSSLLNAKGASLCCSNTVVVELNFNYITYDKLYVVNWVLFVADFL